MFLSATFYYQQFIFWVIKHRDFQKYLQPILARYLPQIGKLIFFLENVLLMWCPWTVSPNYPSKLINIKRYLGVMFIDVKKC